MAKKVAVVMVNPVNGFGLFQYLEAFFENGISYKTYAVANTQKIRTNSGITIKADDVIANLKGHEEEYDALVFACGDAMPKFRDNAAEPYNQDMMAVVKGFSDKGKLLIGHCAVAVLYDALGVGAGKRVAVHPIAKPAIKGCKATDEKFEVDGNLYTAQSENTLWMLMPEVLKALA